MKNIENGKNQLETPPFPEWESIKLFKNIPVSISILNAYIRKNPERKVSSEIPQKGWNDAEIDLGGKKLNIVIDDPQLKMFKSNTQVFQKVLICETNSTKAELIDTDNNLLVPPGYRHMAIVLNDSEVVVFFMKKDLIKSL